MSAWVDAVPDQGLTQAGRYELLYTGDWTVAGISLQAPDPETLRFVVGGRPDVVAESAWIDWRGRGHVEVILQRSGRLADLVGMVAQVPASDDVSPAGPGLVQNLAGAEVVAELDQLRFLGAAGLEQVEQAEAAEEHFRETLGEGELRDVISEGQRRLRQVGIGAGALTAVIMLALLLDALLGE